MGKMLEEKRGDSNEWDLASEVSGALWEILEMRSLKWKLAPLFSRKAHSIIFFQKQVDRLRAELAVKDSRVRDLEEYIDRLTKRVRCLPRGTHRSSPS